MSRTLRRPMFRGGRVSSYGTGIAHGLADGGMPPKRGLVTGPGGYAGDWNWKGGSTGSTTVGSGTQTGGQTLASAADKVSKWSKARNLLSSPKISEQGIYEALKKWGPQAVNWGRGIVGAGIKRFPAITAAMGMEYLSRPGDIDELVYEEEDYGPIEGRLHKILDPTYTSKWMKQAEDYYPLHRIEQAALEGDITKVPDAITGEDPIYKERVVKTDGDPDRPDLPEPVELTAKEMVREKKELFMDLLGADKAKGQDISEMLLGFAGAEGDTTWEKSKAFFRDEAKRPGKLQKIEETAGVLAINDYIAGKRSKENLEQTLGMKKSIIDYDYATKSQIINVTETDSFRSGLGKIAAKYKLDPTSASALKTYFAEVLGLKLHQPKNSNFSLEKLEKREWKDLKVGFNLVSPEGEGKIIIEKKPDGSIDIKEKLVI
jgi:hypothetical protein